MFCPECGEPAQVCADYGTCPMSEASRAWVDVRDDPETTRGAEHPTQPTRAGGCGCKILVFEGEETLLWDFKCVKHAPPAGG